MKGCIRKSFMQEKDLTTALNGEGLSTEEQREEFQVGTKRTHKT